MIMLSSTSSTKVTLVSSDNHQFEVEERVARLSPLINSMFNDEQNIRPAEPIAITEVTGYTLERILHWMQYHQNDGQWNPFADEDDDYENAFPSTAGPLRFETRRGSRRRPRRNNPIMSIPQWDRNFLNNHAIDNCYLYDLITGAHYLQIKRLRNLACTVVEHRINQMGINELCAEFGLPNLRAQNQNLNNLNDGQVQANEEADSDDEIRLIGIDQSRRG